MAIPITIPRLGWTMEEASSSAGSRRTANRCAPATCSSPRKRKSDRRHRMPRRRHPAHSRGCPEGRRHGRGRRVIGHLVEAGETRWHGWRGGRGSRRANVPAAKSKPLTATPARREPPPPIRRRFAPSSPGCRRTRRRFGEPQGSGATAASAQRMCGGGRRSSVVALSGIRRAIAERLLQAKDGGPGDVDDHRRRDRLVGCARQPRRPSPISSSSWPPGLATTSAARRTWADDHLCCRTRSMSASRWIPKPACSSPSCRMRQL